MSHHPIVIIGAGLTGLTLAYLLEKQGLDYLIIEGKDHIGGRIETIESRHHAPLEMGATWIHPEPLWLDFLKELGVSLFTQKMGKKAWVDHQGNKKRAIDIPPQPPMYRIENGTIQIIKKIQQHIAKDSIKTRTACQHIKRLQNGAIEISTNNGVYTSNKVIITLPPKLLVNTLTFNPPLTDTYTALANETATWMEYSTKFTISFEAPFTKPLPYTLFSQSGIIQEMYDHSSQDEQHFALKGFLHPRCVALSQAERATLVINELKAIYNTQFPTAYKYIDKIWRDDDFVSKRTFNETLPKQNNGAAHLKQSQWQNTLFFAGTETAANHSGYMEGALESAKETLHKLIK